MRKPPGQGRLVDAPVPQGRVTAVSQTAEGACWVLGAGQRPAASGALVRGGQASNAPGLLAASASQT